MTELSSGSTALSLAYYCNQLRLKCIIFLLSTTPPKTIEKIRAEGVRTEFVDPANAYEVYNTWAMSEDLLQFNQLFDQDKNKYYSELARKIYCHYPTVNSVIGATELPTVVIPDK